MWKGDNSGIPGVLLVVALVVTFVWAIATLVAIAIPSHPVPPTVNAVMGAMVTALFGFAGLIIAKRNKTNGNGDS